MEELSKILRLIGDETRLRILRLLLNSVLNVSELTSLLGLAQSGISRHLSQLKQTKIIKEQKIGLYNYYQLNQDLKSNTEYHLLWDYLNQQLKKLSDNYGDLARLNELLNQRKDVGEGLNEKLLEPGLSWLIYSRALSLLLNPLKVVDLGCGDGTLSIEIARIASELVAVDLEPKRLKILKQKFSKLRLNNITTLQCSLEDLNLENNAFDLGLFSQSLHHLPDPLKGLFEAKRVLKSGANLLITELLEHDKNWTKDKLKHKHLGFSIKTISDLIKNAGFNLKHIEVSPKSGEQNFRVILALAQKN